MVDEKNPTTPAPPATVGELIESVVRTVAWLAIFGAAAVLSLSGAMKLFLRSDPSAPIAGPAVMLAVGLVLMVGCLIDFVVRNSSD